MINTLSKMVFFETLAGMGSRENPDLAEVVIEFVVEVLLCLYQFGADQMNLPHNFYFGLGVWFIALAIAIRMFLIFPYWVPTLTNLERSLIVVLSVAIMVGLAYRPVMTAYAKRNDGNKAQTPTLPSPAPPPSDTPNSLRQPIDGFLQLDKFIVSPYQGHIYADLTYVNGGDKPVSGAVVQMQTSTVNMGEVKKSIDTKLALDYQKQILTEFKANPLAGATIGPRQGIRTSAYLQDFSEEQREQVKSGKRRIYILSIAAWGDKSPTSRIWPCMWISGIDFNSASPQQIPSHYCDVRAHLEEAKTPSRSATPTPQNPTVDIKAKNFTADGFVIIDGGNSAGSLKVRTTEDTKLTRAFVNGKPADSDKKEEKPQNATQPSPPQ